MEKNQNELRELYYYVARSEQSTVKYGGTTNKDNKDRIDKCNTIAKEFIDVLNESLTDESSWNTWKGKVNAYIASLQGDSDADKKAFGKFWGGQNMSIVNQIFDDRKPGNPTPNTDITANDINSRRDGLDLSKAGDDENVAIKKMFDDNHTAIIAGKKALLDEVENLAKLIYKALTDGKNVKKSDFDTYSGGDANKKAAWGFAEAITIDKRKLTDLAKEKAIMGKDNDQELTDAKAAAKTAMENKMKTGGSDAYDKIIKNSTTLTSKSLVDKAAEIFGKCHDAWKETKENDTLRNELAGYNDATSGEKQTIWTAINLFKKNADNGTCTEGFGKGALKHLQELVTERKKIVEKSKIDKADDEAAVNEALKILEAEKDNDEKIKDVIIPRAKLMAALFKKSQQWFQRVSEIN